MPGRNRVERITGKEIKAGSKRRRVRRIRFLIKKFYKYLYFQYYNEKRRYFMEDTVERVLKIKEKVADLSDKKIRIEERFKSEKASLEKLIEKITSSGYDPKKLTEIKNEKQELLQKALAEIEEKTKNVEQKLSAIEV
jgi:hypothetical protein